MKTARVFHCALAVAAAVHLWSCHSEQRPVHTIESSREVEPVGDGINWHATSSERFGLAGPGHAAPPPVPKAGPTLQWDTPEGWQELAPTQFRAVNFLAPGEPPIECYLTILRGDAGGLAANVNRWRQQMSQPPLAASDLGQLPRLPFFGGEAVFLDVEGTFSGMSGDVQGESYRMLGLLLIQQDSSRFLKLVGPAGAVSDQVQAFRNLAASFSMDAHGDRPEPRGEAPAGSSGFTWNAPEHWQPAPPSSMRRVNFQIADGQVECYVTVLGGGGGGAHANFNRWREQMGQAALSVTEFDALERFEMLGSSAALAEIPGVFRSGERQIQDALMLGVVCDGKAGATFVKMIGPREEVAAEREAFLAFCQSLRTDG